MEEGRTYEGLARNRGKAGAMNRAEMQDNKFGGHLPLMFRLAQK
jgi:hypothetical protein